MSAFEHPAAPAAATDLAWVKQVSAKTLPSTKPTFAVAKYGSRPKSATTHGDAM